MKKTIVLSLVCCFFAVLTIQAQNDEYTYLTDKKFKNAEEFYGYTFVPSLMEVPEPGQTKAGDQVKIKPGSFKFGVSRGNLFVKGDGIDGVHNINQINTTDYGYQLVLMNARDPKQQGHLKIIMLKNYVDALVFKENNNATEMVFLLPEIDKGLLESEKSYFTDKSELTIEFEEDIWGKEVMPFFKTIMPKRVYQRIREDENVKISFIETEKIIEKGKKNKDDMVLAIKDTPAPETVIEDLAPEPEPEPVIEDVVEEVEEEEVDDGFPSYFKVKKKEPETVLEKEEEMEEEIIAAPEVVETTEGDLFAEPEQLEEVQESKKDRKSKKDKSKDKKVKVVFEYDIIINDYVFNDDGSKEPRETKLRVKDWKLRQDDSASNPNEVYQMELETNKGSMYVYLSGSNKITKIEYGPVNYLMRGL